MFSITPRQLIILASLVLLSSVIHSQKKYQSHMWEVSGNGLSKPSYLFGTMHVSEKVAFHLGDPFYDAIQSCDYVALELEPDIWIHDMFKGDYFEKMVNGTYGMFGSGYGGGYYSGNFDFALDNEKILGELLKSSDFLSNFMLLRTTGGRENFEEDSWLDMHIYQCARKLNKKSFGLESFASSMDNAMKASIEQRKSSDKISYTKLQEMEDKMDRAYRDGDLDFVDSLSRMSYPGDAYKFMLTIRNETFVHTIDSLVKTGSVFAAMGCAHLPGPDGVIEMLRAKGYTVKPVNKGERDAKRKAEITKKTLERPHVKFTNAEGNISFEAPSEVYSIANSGDGITYMSLDMPNGGSFFAQLLNAYPVTLQSSQQKNVELLDRLIYEKIPGEIVKQTKQNENGLVVYDVLYKNVKGNYSRMKLMVHDNYLLKLGVSGKGEDVKKGYGKYFLDSFKYVAPTATPVHRLFDDQFEIKVNAIHQINEPDVEIKLHNMIPVILDDSNDLDSYVISKGKMSNFQFIDETDYELEEFANYFFEETGYDDSIQSPITINGKNAIRSSFKDKNDRPIEALFIGGPSSYYVIQAFTDSPERANAVFNTVQLPKSVYKEEYYSMTDSTVKFTAEVPWKVDKDDNKENPFQLLGMGGQQSEEKRDIGKTDFGQTIVTNKNHPFEVSVSMSRSPKYFEALDKKTYEKNAKEILTVNGDLFVAQEKVSWNQDNFTGEYFLTDTSAVRGLRVKKMLTGMREYQLIYSDEVQSLNNPWANRFFESFTPLEDTVLGKTSLFESKINVWSQDIQSTDTLVYHFAQRNAYSMIPETAEELKVLKNLTTISPLATEDESKYITTLHKSFLYVDKSPENIAQLKKEYLAYPDSSDYQIEILSNLTYMRTKESRMVVKELLLKEAPLVEYADFVYALADSVEGIVHIIPSLKPLIDLEEYKWPLIMQLGMALDSGYVKASDYKTWVPTLLREAKLSLKRANSEDIFKDQMDEEYYDISSTLELNFYLNLLHDHQSDPEVAALFKQAKESKKESVALQLAVYQKNRKLTMDDNQVKRLIRDDKKKESLDYLYAIQRADLIPKDWNVLRIYAESLVEGLGEYDSEIQKYQETDSVELLNKFEDRIKQRNYEVFNFKYKVKGKEEWKLAVVAFATQRDPQTSPNESVIYAIEASPEKGMYSNLFKAKDNEEKPKSEARRLRETWKTLKRDNRIVYSYDDYEDEYYYGE